MIQRSCSVTGKTFTAIVTETYKHIRASCRNKLRDTLARAPLSSIQRFPVLKILRAIMHKLVSQRLAESESGSY